MNPIDHTITKAIEHRLTETGKTRYAVAKAAGIPTTTFDRKLIRGSFTVPEVVNIADALDAPVAEILGIAA